MPAKFICSPMFSQVEPINVFHKECNNASVPSSPLKNMHILFRKKVNLDRFDKAVIKITADDYYKLYINGEFVTQGPAPGYPWAYYYNELDVTEYLKEGENTLAVHTYYQGLINRVWVSGDMRAMLWLSLSLDGDEILVSDESWLCHIHSGYSSLGTAGYDTAFLEQYDSACPEAGFQLPDFDDRGWVSAEIYKNADYSLIKQPTRQLDVYYVEPVKLDRISGGLRLDFGREMAGSLYIKANGKSGDEVILRFGEELDGDGAVRFDMRCGCRYEEKWLLSGACDTLEQFDYKAFRYAEVIFPESVEIIEIKMLVRHYPFEQKRRYKTDNADLNRILDLCINTVKYGAQENFIDCPMREKGQYLGDVAIFGRAYAVATGDTALLKKAVRDFLASSKICSGLMAVSGSSLMQEIADYSLLLPALVIWIYRFDGDLELVKEAFPYISAQLEYFKKYMTDEYLLESVLEKWNLVDWPENFRDGYAFALTRPVTPGMHNVINALWCGYLSAYDGLCDILGIKKCSFSDKAKKGFVRKFYNHKTKLFCDTGELTHSAIHSNIFPLLFGIDSLVPESTDSIIRFIEQKGLHACNVYMAYFALAALKSRGEDALCLRLATASDCWLNMLSEGASVTFETWGKNEKWNTSLFHPWASSPLIIFTDGVEPY